MIATLLVGVSLVLPAQAPARARPAAMVLDARGQVEVTPAGEVPRRVAVGELLYPGEHLAVPAGGAATLAILGAGVKETIKPGSTATVDLQGCTPPGAVATRSAQKGAVAGVMRGVRPAPGDGRKAGVGFRGADDPPEAPPAVTPIAGATVASDRPALAWKPVQGVTGYRVRLRSGAGRELWEAEAEGPTLTYPETEQALQRGYVYSWEVADAAGKPLVKSTFAVATASESKKLVELAELAAVEDRADLLAAALAYTKLGAYGEALAAYETLARLAPDEPAHREALAALYARAGRPSAAAAARRKWARGGN